MKSRFTFFVLLLVFASLLGACSQSSGEPQPPNIAYGRDMCDACNMIISEARFAAATVLTDGKTYKFDDAGEMFAFHAKKSELQVRAWFVHDYHSQNWINAQSAFYVVAKDIKSPMGTGVAAFVDKSAAESFASRFNVKVMIFDEIRTAKPSMGGH